MIRTFSAALVTLALVSPAFAQDGPLRRTGRALDSAGKNIRSRVESEVARGQITAQERELFNRIAGRIDFDKRLTGSTMQMQVREAGVVVLKGSVMSDAAKLTAVELVESTLGVTSVIDELAVVKSVKVINAKPAERVIEVTTPVTVPADTKVILKP